MRLGTWWRGARAGVLRPIFVVALAAMLGAAAVQARPGGAKTLTVERIYSAPSLSGYLTEGIEWSPDSKRVSYFGQGRSGLEMWTTDAATGERKVLVKADVLAAAMPPEKTSAIQSTGLGRVQAENYQWSPDGRCAAFHRRQQAGSARSEDDGVEGAGDRRERRRRPEVFAGRQMGELRARREPVRRERRDR